MDRVCADCGRNFEGRREARYCPDCRWKHWGKKRKYQWTEEKDDYMRRRYDGKVWGRAAEIAALWGWPIWAIKRRAAVLGLTHEHKRRDWTQEEEDFLLEYAGRRHVNWMAGRLGRTITSVVLKLKRMRISRAFREGYTLRELSLCFGADHHAIERWVRAGWLEISRRGTERLRDAWKVNEAQILKFITEHPMDFRLDKVDQLWFMDLILGGGLMREERYVDCDMGSAVCAGV